MYSGMRSTSALYPSYPYHPNQSSHEQFNGQLPSIVTGYPLHQNQNHDYGVYQSSMANNGPTFYPGFTGQPVQEAMTYPVFQPAVTQAQEPQVPVRGNADPPKFRNRRQRLIWTSQLHECFIHAAMQLGGVFEAKPRAILEIMNVRGLTMDHVKSHLQRMRRKRLDDISAEEIMNHGIRSNGNIHAPQVMTEGEASSSSRPKFVSNSGGFHGSYETPNSQQTLEIPPGDDLDEFFNLEYFDLL